MQAEIRGKKFAFELHPLTANRFRFYETGPGKRVLAGEGIFGFSEGTISLRNIEVKPGRGIPAGAGLIRAAMRFLAERHPEAKVLTYYKLVRGKPGKSVRVSLERLRGKAARGGKRPGLRLRRGG